MPEDLIAGREALDAVADGIDDPGPVAAENDRKLVFGHSLQQSSADRGVDLVEPGGLDADADLAGPDLGDRTLAKGGSAVEVAERKCLHRVSFPVRRWR